MENELLTLKKELEEKLNECQKEADVLIYEKTWGRGAGTSCIGKNRVLSSKYIF